MITLLISPIARRFKLGALIKVRRLIGLYSFFWAAIHLLVYLALDLNFDGSLLASEIASRPYLTLGAISWLILSILLAREASFLTYLWLSTSIVASAIAPIDFRQTATL